MDENSFNLESSHNTEPNPNQNPINPNDFNSVEKPISEISDKTEEQNYNPQVEEPNIQDTITELKKQNEEFDNRLYSIEDKLDILTLWVDRNHVRQERLVRDMEKTVQHREFIKAQIIGAVLGGATGLMIGVSGGTDTALLTGAVSGALTVASIFQESRINKLESKINSTLGEERARLVKKLDSLDKIKSSTPQSLVFLSSVSAGAMASLFLR